MPADDLERRATAAVLATGSSVGRSSLALAVLAAAAAFFLPPAPAGVRALLFASLALAVVEGWYALRVAVDARLFAVEGMEADLRALDRVLTRLLGAPPADRPFAERSAGALRLWKRQVTTALFQVLCLLAACGIWLAAR